MCVGRNAMKFSLKISLNNPQWDLDILPTTQYARGRGGWGASINKI